MEKARFGRIRLELFPGIEQANPSKYNMYNDKMNMMNP